VVERSVGGFAGRSQPNDLFSKVMHDWDLYTCCSAQGVRGLFNAWTHATTFDGSSISVNLLINSISAQAIVSSWLPVNGRIEVVPKQDCVVRVRMPDGVGFGDIDVSAKGAKVQNTSVSNGYLMGCCHSVCENPIYSWRLVDELVDLDICVLAVV
jgi:hypothetical protein